MPTTDTSSNIAACDGADRGPQAVVLGRIIAAHEVDDRSHLPASPRS